MAAQQRRSRAAMAGVFAGAAVLWLLAFSDTEGVGIGGRFSLRSLLGGGGGDAADYMYESSSSRALVRRSLSTSYDTSQTETLPAFYDNIKNVWDTQVTNEDQPLFWYVPRAGGATLAKIFSFCLDMVTASSLSIESPANTLQINQQSGGARYLNIDPSTSAGISRAITLQAVQNRMADVILTHRLYEASAMVTSANNGRLFVLLHHPVHRAIEQFYYRQRATWEADFDPTLAGMSLLEYSKSDKLVTNYVTRSILNHVDEALTAADVELAKAVLRRKFLIGINEWYERTVVRFEQYFGWWDQYDVLNDQTINFCHHREVTKKKTTYPTPDRNSASFKMIALRNWADLELYLYAKQLFNRQSVLMN